MGSIHLLYGCVVGGWHVVWRIHMSLWFSKEPPDDSCWDVIFRFWIGAWGLTIAEKVVCVGRRNGMKVLCYVIWLLFLHNGMADRSKCHLEPIKGYIVSKVYHLFSHVNPTACLDINKDVTPWIFIQEITLKCLFPLENEVFFIRKMNYQKENNRKYIFTKTIKIT